MKAKSAKPAVRIPDPTLIGYLAKPMMARPEGFNVQGVEEICSVATCIARGAIDWNSEFRQNEMWLFDSPELAWSAVPEAVRPQCGLYAYCLFPLRYYLGQRVPSTIPNVKPMPLDNSFIKLGYDLVSCEHGNQLDHSPLSCNGLGEEVPTNRYCLLERAEDAFAIAPTLEVPGQPLRGEPGPYHIVEVWRQRKA